MSLSLVILAAGIGARFGGNKPLASVGPAGQSLFEYSVYDAVQAGFQHIVFVVREHQDTTEFKRRLERYGPELKIEFVIQSLTTAVEHPATELGDLNRTKPWGTAHAVLACRKSVRNPFVVINADDYYGRENFNVIGCYLQQHAQRPQTCAMPGYALINTLSGAGGVNRGICRVNNDGMLESIVEVKNITQDQLASSTGHGVAGGERLTEASIVSMTFWGFLPSIFDTLQDQFDLFVKQRNRRFEDEFYIPSVIDSALKSDSLQVKVFPTSEKWKGLTYAEDLAQVQAFIRHLTELGEYAKL